MKLVIKGASICILLVFLVALLFANITGTAHAATIHTQFPATSQDNWITKAQPYVHVHNGLAIVDKVISHYLSADEIAKVNASVAHYNSLPASIRLHPNISGSVIGHNNTKTLQSASTSFQWTLNWFWWGLRVWVNSPLAQSIGAGYAVPAALLAGVPPLAFVAVVYGAAIIIYDNMCGNRGVFLDFPYLPPGVSGHPSSVC